MDKDDVQYWRKKAMELKYITESLLEYIDSIPKEIEFNKAMPEIDRDYIESVLNDI